MSSNQLTIKQLAFIAFKRQHLLRTVFIVAFFGTLLLMLYFPVSYTTQASFQDIQENAMQSPLKAIESKMKSSTNSKKNENKAYTWLLSHRFVAPLLKKHHINVHATYFNPFWHYTSHLYYHIMSYSRYYHYTPIVDIKEWKTSKPYHKIYIKPTSDEECLIKDGSQTHLVRKGDTLALPSGPLCLQGWSPSAQKKWIKLKHYPIQEYYYSFAKRLNFRVNEKKDRKAIIIKMRHPDKARATAFLEDLFNAYLVFCHNEQIKMLDDQLDYLQKQHQQVKADLAKRLAKKQGQILADIKGGQYALLHQKEALTEQLKQIERRLYELTLVEKSTAKALKQDTPSLDMDIGGVGHEWVACEKEKMDVKGILNQCPSQKPPAEHVIYVGSDLGYAKKRLHDLANQNFKALSKQEQSRMIALCYNLMASFDVKQKQLMQLIHATLNDRASNVQTEVSSLKEKEKELKSQIKALSERFSELATYELEQKKDEKLLININKLIVEKDLGQSSIDVTAKVIDPPFAYTYPDMSIAGPVSLGMALLALLFVYVWSVAHAVSTGLVIVDRDLLKSLGYCLMPSIGTARIASGIDQAIFPLPISIHSRKLIALVQSSGPALVYPVLQALKEVGYKVQVISLESQKPLYQKLVGDMTGFATTVKEQLFKDSQLHQLKEQYRDTDYIIVLINEAVDRALLQKCSEVFDAAFVALRYEPLDDLILSDKLHYVPIV